MRIRLFVVLAVVCAGVIALAAPAMAGGDGGSRRDDDRRITVTGDVVVAPGEVVGDVVVSIDGSVRIDGTVLDDVYVGRGDLAIDGRVSGDVLVVRGDAVITGRVGGDVVVVSGRAIVREGASVGGDVTSGDKPQVARGTVDGEVDSLDSGSIFGGFLIAFLIFLWIATTVSLALLGLAFVWLFPRAADAAALAASRVGPSIGIGLLVGIFGPAVGVFIFSTVIGIPLGIVVLAALALLTPLGYVTSSYCLGRRLVKGEGTGQRIGAFFAGFGILRAAALVPGIGFLVWIGATVYGIGALTIAAWWASRRDPSGSTTPPAPTPKPEPAKATPAKKAAPAKKATGSKN